MKTVCLSVCVLASLLLPVMSASSTEKIESALTQVTTTTPQPELQELITNAITRFEETQIQQWSYVVSRYENEEGTITSSLERFDPRLKDVEKWSLLQINNREPSDQQREEFVNKKLKSSDQQNNISIKLAELIQTDTLTITQEDEAQVQAKFDVYLERLGASASKSLQGILVYSKSEQYIERIEITNTKKFAPVFSAVITDFTLTFEFLNMDTAVFTKQIDLSMKGKFALFVEIDEVSTDTYSDFQYWGED